jgi:aspartate ammonia-lyase
MNSDDVGTPLKHPEKINDNVKNLSKRMNMKNKEFPQIVLVGRSFECVAIYFHATFLFSIG